MPPAFSFENCTAVHISAAPTAIDASCAINLRVDYGLALHFNLRMDVKYVALNRLEGAVNELIMYIHSWLLVQELRGDLKTDSTNGSHLRLASRLI